MRRTVVMRGWLAGLVMAVLALSRGWASPGQAFANAGALLARGEAGEAVRAYEELLRTNGPTVALLHNLALARLQDGQPARALAAWRRAELIDPRDADVRGSLGYLRRQLGGDDPGPVRPGPVTVGEWSLLAAAAWWGWGIVLLAGRASPSLRDRLTAVRAVLAGVAVALVLVAGWALWARRTGPSAVVVARDVPLRVAPASEAPGAGSLAEGAEVRLLRRHRDWYEVAVEGRRLGWVMRSQVEPWTPEARGL